MQRHFDKTGRIVIPKEMRKELGFESEDYAEIELIDNKIILSNPKNSKYKQLEFLKERENKLQNIEYILKNIDTVTINDIKNILEINAKKGK